MAELCLHVVHALGSGRQFREMEIAGAFHLGDVEDLTGVVREMLGDIEDGVEPGDAEALDGMHLQERFGGQPAEDVHRFVYSFFQPECQNAACERAALGKFGVTAPDVGSPAEAGNNPLADVSAQMKHKIAGAVGRGIWAPPDLVFGEFAEAANDTREVTLERFLSGGKIEPGDTCIAGATTCR